ncbi:methyl-accepting chemotaxis protein [Paenibacillus soyae]|uniref:Methyl-accepting chemotaxis protein n=1 Tax=Paenibacillus soyae TaxID=2969249 RepID=A0A9X2MKL8_9BACL|nr:methyl-accepting chemotaxis protein [Paenibacillus soyae]MCR2803668.1 methyl-accepting chemotaxis protein [Paenibacillus soyae]
MRLSLRVKLILLAAVPLLFYAGTGIFQLGEQKSVYNEMKTDVVDKMSRIESLILNADRDMYQASMSYLLLETGKLDAEAKNANLTELSENYRQALDRVAEAKMLAETSGLMAAASEQTGKTTTELYEVFESDFGNWYKDAILLADDGQSVPVNAALDELFEGGRSAIDEISGIAELHSAELMSGIEERLNKNRLSVLVGIIAVSILLTLMVTFIIIRVMGTIRTVVRKMQLVGDGDLTSERESRYSKDELGLISRSTDDMIDSMSKLVTGIVSSTKQVGDSSSQLSKSAGESAAASEHVAIHIQEVASGSEKQARSAEETSRAIEEMTLGITRIAENTSDLADQSQTTASQADQGQAALLRLLSQMEEIKAIIGKLSSTIHMLENRSQEIGSIAQNITAFSNQTNILSLNASIEAARAGEHGRGFAVVAGEIRKLAAGSLESAESINGLVSLTQGEIAGASAYMSRTLVEVERGSERVNEVNEKLTAITAAIVQMTEQLQENSAITQQMSASSEEVSASVEQSASTAAANLGKTESVAAATEEQLALMENISSSANELDEIVKQLSSAVSHFKVKVS